MPVSEPAPAPAPVQAPAEPKPQPKQEPPKVDPAPAPISQPAASKQPLAPVKKTYDLPDLKQKRGGPNDTDFLKMQYDDIKRQQTFDPVAD